MKSFSANSPQSRFILLTAFICFCWLISGDPSQLAIAQKTADSQPAAPQTIRFASYNIAMNRPSEGELKKELLGGESDQARKIAEVIQRTRPDVLLLCEFDYDEQGVGLAAFQKKYLSVSQRGNDPIEYPHIYFAPVNTGVDTGLDLDGDGRLGTGNDAFGFGQFPGKYAMAVLSKFEIDTPNVRTFQKFLWKDMPGALLPKTENGKPYYSAAATKIFRLSSKSHWDVPIQIKGTTVHLLASHPTPPVFDGPEDKNGKRNHDEIRLFADYVSGKADYLYDDRGNRGGLAAGSHFVIVGDLNADPLDGDSYDGAINQLLRLPVVAAHPIPLSKGGVHFAKSQGGANVGQKGDPASDTGDFNDERTGNVRVDYCLPSKTLKVKRSGVFWPLPDEPGGEAVKASDHRMVWIDVVVSGK